MESIRILFVSLNDNGFPAFARVEGKLESGIAMPPASMESDFVALYKTA
jgi:hypothetical protein